MTGGLPFIPYPPIEPHSIIFVGFGAGGWILAHRRRGELRRNGTNMEGDTMPSELHRYDVRRMVAEGAQLVEVLPREEYDAEHIAGAINIPLRELTRETTARLDRERPVIVYCWDYQ